MKDKFKGHGLHIHGGRIYRHAYRVQTNLFIPYSQQQEVWSDTVQIIEGVWWIQQGGHSPGEVTGAWTILHA